ncbi:MAG: NosD domain-containing protein [Candidatus Bathyarchaeia archaeon]
MRKTLRNTLTLCALLMLLFSAFLSIGFVRGEGTDNRIFIQPDGSVIPAGAPIRTEGNTYILTGNVSTSIVIEKSDITLDGRGHILQGTFNGTKADLWMIGSGPQVAATSGPVVPWTIGIDISDSNVTNLTIENIKVENFSIGMYIWTQNNTIKSDTIKGNIVGVLIAASQNSFTKNYIENNTDGIFVGIGSPTNPYTNVAIHNNYFVNNTQQVDGCHCPASQNETNPWGINVDSNYWSDYNGTDKNSDGVGVVPYLVNGTIPDDHPLMQLPSAQTPETPINSNIEILLAVSLPFILIIAFITLKKRKNQSSKLEKKLASYS